MVKKFASVVLSLAMLLSVVGVSATPVTDEKGRVIYTDNFEHCESGDAFNVKNNADTTISKPYTSSDVLIPWTANYTKGQATIVTVTGPDGNDTLAMQIGNKNDSRFLQTIALDIGSETSTKEYEISYDFMVDSINASSTNTLHILTNSATTSARPLFQLSNAGYIKTTTDGSTFTDSSLSYSADSWYHVAAIIKGTNVTAWLTDGEGNGVYSKRSDMTYTNLSPFWMHSSTAGSLTLTLDNLKIVEYNPSAVAPEIQGAPTADATEKVLRNVALSFELDQMVTVDPLVTNVVTLGKINADESITPVSGAAVSVIPNSRKVTVTYTGLLERNTKYVVSLTNLKNASGLSCSTTYEFTTEDLHLWEPVTIGSIGSPDAVTGLTPVTFTIADSHDYPTFDGAALVTVYQNGKMVACDMQSLTAVSVGSCTKDFNLGTIPTGATVCVVLLDCLAGPVPLASGTTN